MTSAPIASIPSKRDVVTATDQLAKAAGNSDIPAIVVRGQLVDAPSCRLAPGQSLSGEDGSTAITFIAGSDGLQLSTDNEVCGVALHAGARGCRRRVR
ncbi:MAG: hypothetical protein ABI580_02350 [Burkholderiaceae bacterium]